MRNALKNAGDAQELAVKIIKGFTIENNIMYISTEKIGDFSGFNPTVLLKYLDNGHCIVNISFLDNKFCLNKHIFFETSFQFQTFINSAIS